MDQVIVWYRLHRILFLLDILRIYWLSFNHTSECSIAVMFCIIAYLFLLFHIIYGIFKRRKEKRKYNKALMWYYRNKMKSISLDS